MGRRGVSLVELSVVIAVIGLLLAAVVAGLGIRKSAEMRGMLTEVSGFQSSIESFFSKYNTLPGDMPDAHTYWDNGANTVCGTATQCNGNNNGRIELNASDGLDSESYRAWQHLVLSDFLSGGYTGTATTSNIQADIGINVPASKRTKVGYNITYSNTGDGSRSEIMLGAFYASNINSNAAITPAEALAIDLKLDDGVPATGLVHGVDGSDMVLSGDADGTGNNCRLSGAYNTANTAVACTSTFPAKR